MNNTNDNRYAKQILFRPIGEEGQEKIERSTVAVVGLGALGTVIASHLARAGVGRLRLIDRDFVELGNLQRQILFDESDARERLPKAVAAAEKLRAVNSEIEIDPHIADLSAGNAESLLAGVDLILDGTDNLETRFLINDVAVKSRTPWIYGGALGSVGMSLTVVPGRTACLRCFITEPPAPGTMPSCDTEGVLSAATGVVASIQSAEALRLLVGGEARRTLIHVDVWTGDFDVLALERQEGCPACAGGEYDYLAGRGTSWTTVLCGRNAVQIVPPGERQIALTELQERLARTGRVAFNGFLLSFQAEGRDLSLFPNGRAIIRGTTDEMEARSFYARYVGV